MELRYQGLAASGFSHLFGLSDDALNLRGMRRMIVDAKPGFPCRVTLEDAEPGERVLLLAFEHQPAHSPFRASGPIFVREGEYAMFDRVSAPPPVFNGRRGGRSAFATPVRCARDGLCAHSFRAPRLLRLPRGAGVK